MKIAILGTGGVGGYFGACLAKAGHHVTFLARGNHLHALRHDGLHIKSIKGDFTVYPVNVTDKINQIDRQDLVIVTVKAWQVKGIAGHLKSLMDDNTLVLPLQNGLLAPQEISTYIGQSNLLGGLCRIFSQIESPGVISHFGIEPTIVFGELNHTISDRSKSIKQIFTDAGISTNLTDNIQVEMWKKFIPICTSALLALTRTTYGEIRAIPETRLLTKELMNEGFMLSQRAGVQLADDFVEKAMAAIDSFGYETTSSLTRDIWEGKPSELEYQNGTIVKLGKKYDVPVPVNTFIYHCLLPMEKKARGI